MSILEEARLVENIFDKDALEKKPTRDGFGKGLVEAGEADSRVMVLCADLADSTRAQWFRDKFPERYVELGVAEQNLATVASGLANYGKIPFITSYAAFSPGRNNEQIRTTIALNHVPVKIAGAHAGVSVGPDGATHQQLEDVALMRVQPNMVVVVPADAEEARKATFQSAFYKDPYVEDESVIKGSPVYLRFTRDNRAVFTTVDTPFSIGKANLLFDNNKGGDLDVAIIGCSPLVYNALLSAKELSESGLKVAVLNNHTIKPMDNTAILELARRAGAIVTVEEHQVAGGMGSAVAELLALEMPTPMEFIGVHDKFGQSGNPDELFSHYGLDVPSIIKASRKVISRKK